MFLTVYGKGDVERGYPKCYAASGVIQRGDNQRVMQPQGGYREG